MFSSNKNYTIIDGDPIISTSLSQKLESMNMGDQSRNNDNNIKFNLFQSLKSNLVKYYGNPIFTKLKSTKSHSIYYCKVGCLMCIDNRYLTVVCHNYGDPMYNKNRLSDLNWISFQTRTIDGDADLEKLQTIELLPDKNILRDKITINNRLNDRYSYNIVDKISQTHMYPIKLDLLFTPSDTFYSDEGTLSSALETYNCILTPV